MESAVNVTTECRRVAGGRARRGTETSHGAAAHRSRALAACGQAVNVREGGDGDVLGQGRPEHQIFLSSSFGSGGRVFRRTRCIAFMATADPVPASRVYAAAASALGVPPGDLRLTTGAGRCLPARLALDAGGHTFLSAGLRLLGGKGGFGSMLRAQGGRMASQKTTNFEACRDLSGRRLKTVNEAKKLADYVEKEPERQKAKDENMRKRIENGLKEPTPKKHRFDDPKFFEETEEMGEEAANAVLQVLNKPSTKDAKPRASEKPTPVPAAASASAKAPLAMWEEDFSSSDDDEKAEDTEKEEAEKAEAENGEAEKEEVEKGEAEKGEAEKEETEKEETEKEQPKCEGASPAKGKAKAKAKGKGKGKVPAASRKKKAK